MSQTEKTTENVEKKVKTPRVKKTRAQKVAIVKAVFTEVAQWLKLVAGKI
jgi:hypothetical protein